VARGQHMLRRRSTPSSHNIPRNQNTLSILRNHSTPNIPSILRNQSVRKAEISERPGAISLWLEARADEKRSCERANECEHELPVLWFQSH
jgi:hypothetical protein